MATQTSKLIVELVDRVTAPTRAIAASVKSLTDAQARNTARLNAVRGQMLDAVGVGYALAKSVAAPIKSAMALESAMADVAKVTNFDDAGLKGFERALRDLAVSEIPLAVTELTALAAAAAQSGVPEKELLDFTRTTAKAAVAWEVSGALAGESLANLRSALGLTNKEVALYADVINHLSDNTASSAPDLVDFAKEVAAQGEFFGIARDQSLAFGAAMIGAGAQANVAATSFRNMGRSLTRGTSATKRQSAAYGKLGLDAVRVAKAMQKDAVATILDVMERLGALPDHVQASVMSDLFGDEARALAPLLGRMDILREALGHVSDETAYAGSVNDEFARRAETTEYALQRFRSRINELGIVIGSALMPALNDLLETFGPMVNRVAELADRYPVLTRAIIATAAGLVALRVAAIAAQFAFFWMRGGVLSAAILGLRGLAGAGRLVAVAFLPVTAGLRALRTAMIGYAASAAVAGHGTALASMGRGLLGLLNPMRLVTGAFRVLRVVLIGTGIGAVLVGIAAAGTWIYNNWSGIATMFEAFGGAFMQAIKPIMPALQPVIDGFSWLRDTVAGLLGPVDELGGSWAQIGIEAGKAVGEAVVALAGLPAQIAEIWSSSSWSEIGQMIADSLLGAFGGIGDALTAAFTNAAELIGSIDWASAGVAVGQAVVAGLSGVLHLGELLLGAFGGEGAAGIGTTVAAAIGGALTAFNWRGVGSAIINYLGSVLSAAGDFFGGIIKGLFGDIDLQAEAAAIVASLRDSVSAMASQMIDAGRALMAQLLEGIKAGAQAVLDYMVGLGSRLKNSVTGAVSGAWSSVKGAVGLGGDSPAVAGARAAGGPVRAGGTYLVGERGPELVTFPQAGFVHDAIKTARIMRNAALASAVALPAATTPAMPTGQTPSISIASGAVTITVQAAPGQSPEQIAEAVERALSSKLTTLYNGAFHDGVN